MTFRASAALAVCIAAALSSASDAQTSTRIRAARPAVSAAPGEAKDAVVLRPSGPGPAMHTRTVAHGGAPLAIAALRARVAQLGLHDETSPTPSGAGSWSETLGANRLSAEPAPGVSLFTNIGGTGWWNVNAYQADMSEHGLIAIGAHGLTPGKVYVVGCTIRFQKLFSGKVPFQIGDQETAVSATAFSNTYAMPFFAPPGGDVTIWVRPPDTPGGWVWDGCVIGTAT